MITMLLSGLAGAVTWLAAEYLIHRFVGHRPSSMNPFAVEHRRHHSQGNYFAPNHVKAAAALPVIGVMLGLTTLLMGAAGAVYTLGFALTYVGYEMAHRRLHTHAPVTAFQRWARVHHFHHHFGDVRSNHGVTSPVMDWVFGTAQKPGRIRVPRKLAMQWLVDPVTSQVRAEYANDYVLSGSAAPKDVPAADQAAADVSAA